MQKRSNWMFSNQWQHEHARYGATNADALLPETASLDDYTASPRETRPHIPHAGARA